MQPHPLCILLAFGTFALGCAGHNANDPFAAADASPIADQSPPTGRAAVEAWLAAGTYKAWTCESTVHASREPSPHGFNRICSNAVIASNASGTASWPVGAAAVKELFESATDVVPIGYSLYLKQDADSAGGAGWYWYERIDDSIYADGRGSSGTARSICVGCHQRAGADSRHTPSPGGRDLVYTPVSAP